MISLLDILFPTTLLSICLELAYVVCEERGLEVASFLRRFTNNIYTQRFTYTI